jgi:hypothetical protein
MKAAWDRRGDARKRNVLYAELTVEHSSLTVTAAILVVALAIALSACSGSHRSSERAFSDQVRAICKTLATQQAVIARRTGKKASPSAIERQDRANSRASDNWYRRLRALAPPASSGVSAIEWKRSIDLQRRDLRAIEAFYSKETPRLIRSFRKTNRAPKLPPGTGPTATILAQAFNSAEGHRYLRLQRKLLRRTNVDFRAWTRLMRKVGLLKACSPASARSTTTTVQSTIPATTTHP